MRARTAAGVRSATAREAKGSPGSVGEPSERYTAPAPIGRANKATTATVRRAHARPEADDEAFSAASAAASSRRDTSTRAASASAAPISPAARSRSISSNWSRYTATSLPEVVPFRRASGHKTAKIAAAVISASASHKVIGSF
jgi:hypothetical protein